MTDIGEWAESRRLKIEQQLSDVMAMIETDNATAFARRAPLSIAQLNSSVRGRRALVHAVVHNRVEMARTLLAEGANANLSDTRGLPLMCAVTRVPADLDMLRVLLRFGADASVVASSTAIALPLAALLLAQPREPLLLDSLSMVTIEEIEKEFLNQSFLSVSLCFVSFVPTNLTIRSSHRHCEQKSNELKMTDDYDSMTVDLGQYCQHREHCHWHHT
jgi:ankyrin repeat protein